MFDFGIPGWQAQGVGGDFQLALQVVTVGGLQNGFQLALFGGQRVEIGVGFGVGSVDFVQAGLCVLDLADRFFNNVAHGLAVVQLRLLRQVTDLDAGHRAGFALDFGVDTGHDAQQGGFTCAVEAQYADLGAREEGQ